ncbi:hypothetical protein CYY_003066 [Polysphondylium violaceum]|uniref:Peptide deformylase n=1 Tax=Polysphondylium violaceum TaxID=133409 RepID=A0A8J4V1N9_9MYCE|nr:hypothetical protein CYY_003066 [Polysphondylium violaceum]
MNKGFEISSKVLKLGNKLLRQRAEPWTREELAQTDKIGSLLEKMVDTMNAGNGTGLAAPQVGLSKQLFIFKLDSVDESFKCPPFPLTAFFNPVIEIVDEDVEKKQATGSASSSRMLNLQKYKRSIHSATNSLPKKPTDNNTIAIWESCLSMPNYFAKVPRARKCIVKFLDVTGKERAIEADGIIAACLQHENDHLLGRLLIDRLKDPNLQLVCQDEMTDNDFNDIFTHSGDFQIVK